MKFHVYGLGDSSVGIPGSQVTVEWNELDENPGDNENVVFIKFVKERLQAAFKEIFDDKTTVVMTDKEFEQYTSVMKFEE